MCGLNILLPFLLLSVGAQLVNAAGGGGNWTGNENPAYASTQQCKWTGNCPDESDTGCWGETHGSSPSFSWVNQCGSTEECHAMHAAGNPNSCDPNDSSCCCVHYWPGNVSEGGYCGQPNCNSSSECKAGPQTESRSDENRGDTGEDKASSHDGDKEPDDNKKKKRDDDKKKERDDDKKKKRDDDKKKGRAKQSGKSGKSSKKGGSKGSRRRLRRI